MIPATTPLAIWTARKIYGKSIAYSSNVECDKIWLHCRDARTSATKELITNIKPIKVSDQLTSADQLNAWETYFLRRIKLLRQTEVQ